MKIETLAREYCSHRRVLVCHVIQQGVKIYVTLGGGNQDMVHVRWGGMRRASETEGAVTADSRQTGAEQARIAELVS